MGCWTPSATVHSDRRMRGSAADPEASHHPRLRRTASHPPARHLPPCRSTLRCRRKVGCAPPFREQERILDRDLRHGRRLFRCRRCRDPRLLAGAIKGAGADGSAGPLGGRKKGIPNRRDAIEGYLEFLETHLKSAAEARSSANAYILPALGKIKLDDLKANQISKWLAGVAKSPARVRTKKGASQRFRAPKAEDDPDELERRRKSTANCIFTTLKAALNRAWRKGARRQRSGMAPGRIL